MAKKIAKFEFQKSLILFCQEKSHIEGLARSGVQYLHLAPDMQFFYFLVFWFRLADQKAVISYVRLRPEADIPDYYDLAPRNSKLQAKSSISYWWVERESLPP